MPRRVIDFGSWSVNDLTEHMKQVVEAFSLEEFITAVSASLDYDGKCELEYRMKRDINDAEAEGK